MPILSLVIVILLTFIIIFLLFWLWRSRKHSIGQISQLNNQLTDLSGQKQHLQQLNQNQALSLTTEQHKLSAILSSLPDGLLAVDTKRQVVMTNLAAQQLTGFHFAEMVNKPLDQWLDLKDSSGRLLTAQEYCPIGVSKYQTDPKQMMTLAGKGVTNYVGIYSTNLQSAVQTNLGWVVVIKDMARTRQLESQQLDFVSMASHELRTPLTSMKGYLSVFMEENKGKFNPDQNDLLERMAISTQQLVDLVTNLLNVSKVERGAFTVNLSPVDWQKVVVTSVDESRLYANQKNITLELIPPQTPIPQVMADNIRIMEVINNLVNNAINYTRQGGWVKVNVKVEGDHVVTSVSDNGVGIPPEAMAHLFTKFFRAAGSLDKSSNSKGTGLGLYLSKSIIDLHRGKIWVESKAGIGSTFFFTLPIALQTHAGLTPAA